MLSCRGISVAYGRTNVINDVSVDIPDGQILALLGPNGTGKTTLLRALNGSVPLSAGKIELNRKLLSSFSRREIAQHIAVVAQENETKFPVTVLDFVLAGRFASGSAFGWETENDIAAARKALTECDLTDFADRLMNELSGGERQRVVLARAMATEAKVFLLDEPTANLDLAHQALMFRLIRDRCRKQSCSAVVITHDLTVARAITDRVLVMDAGRIVESGKTADVLAHPRSPAATALVAAAPDLQRAIARRLREAG